MTVVRDREYERGNIEVVDVKPHRAALVGDHASGSTVLTVAVTEAVFNKAGGQVIVNGVLYTYTAYDDISDATTLTLPGTGLTAAASDDDWVNVYDPLYGKIKTTKAGRVRLLGAADNDEPLHAVFAQQLVDKLGGGIRSTVGEECLLELDGDTWRIIDIYGLEFLSPHPDPESGGATKFWNDATLATATGAQEITLTYLPIENSEHVYWNGVYQAAPEWTRSGQVISLPDSPAGCFEVDDRISVEYAYLDGTTIVTPDVPDVGVEYADGLIYKPVLDDARWVATSDGWGSWWQACHFSIMSQPDIGWRAYLVIKNTSTWVSYVWGFDLTTYMGVAYREDRSSPLNAPSGDPTLLTLNFDIPVSNGRHTPYVPQGTPEVAIVGAGVYKGYGPAIYDDVPQDLGANAALARIGVTSSVLVNAYWGVKVADNPADTTDEPVGPL